MIKVEATQEEWQALIALIDAGVRASGIRGAGTAVGWVIKIEKAVTEKTPEEPDRGLKFP